MNGRFFTFGASGNPLAQFLSLVVFAALVVVAVVMGAFVLLAFLGLAAIGVVVFSLRMWWLRRKMRRRGPADGGPAANIRYIEGEYEVVSTDADVSRRRPDGRA